MTTIAVQEINPAAKRGRLLYRLKATYARPHGRPGNVRKQLKVKRVKEAVNG